MNNRYNEEYGYKVWGLLNQTRDWLMRARAAELRKYRVTPIKGLLLSIIRNLENNNEEVTLNRILMSGPYVRRYHSLSAIVARMEKDGLINRVREPENNNLIIISLTEKGEEIYQKWSERDSVHKIMSSLSEKDLQQLETYLGTLMEKARTLPN